MATSLAVTPGEPAGIGADLLLKVIQSPCDCELVAYADPELLEQRARQLGLPLRLRQANGQSLAGGELAIQPVEMAVPASAGKLDQRNAPYVLKTLDRAIDDCRSGNAQGLVTGPINKAVINASGIRFTGHTEYLAKRMATPQVVMMLATEQLRVALVTTHLPLREVADTIDQSLIENVLRIVHRDLQNRFNLPSPAILVCGLNPHAGESGHLGTEEIDTIIPALESARSEGINAKGPFPADTVFTPSVLSGGDVVLAMYHDQGLPVLKYQGFKKAVNITLGLPIVRTSVDHGTALELAGSGRGDTGSLISAIETARSMAQAQKP